MSKNYDDIVIYLKNGNKVVLNNIIAYFIETNNFVVEMPSEYKDNMIKLIIYPYDNIEWIDINDILSDKLEPIIEDIGHECY